MRSLIIWVIGIDLVCWFLYLFLKAFLLLIIVSLIVRGFWALGRTTITLLSFLDWRVYQLIMTVIHSFWPWMILVFRFLYSNFNIIQHALTFPLTSISFLVSMCFSFLKLIIIFHSHVAGYPNHLPIFEGFVAILFDVIMLTQWHCIAPKVTHIFALGSFFIFLFQINSFACFLAIFWSFRTHHQPYGLQDWQLRSRH